MGTRLTNGGNGQDHKAKPSTPIIVVTGIILASYSLFFLFQISTEFNVRQMILQESTTQQEQVILQIASDLEEGNRGNDLSLQMEQTLSTAPELVYDDKIEDIGVIDESGYFVWNIERTKIGSDLMTPSDIFSKIASTRNGEIEADRGVGKPVSIVHRIDGSEYLMSIMPISNLYSNSQQPNGSEANGEGNTLYLVASTPLSVLLDEIDNILFGQRIQNFSLVAGVSLVTIIMTFFMNRNIRLNKEVKKHAMELEESNKLIRTQQMAMERANSELRKLDEMKDNFISVASHELKNPIQPILLCSELAKRGEMEKEKALDIVLVNARKLRQLASDILDVSKIDSGNFSCIIGKVRINEMVSELVKSSVLVGSSNVKLEISIDQDVEIDGDRVRLFQVFSNLISNAAKFTPEGVIRLETKTFLERNRVEIAVRDTGTGIPDEILLSLFSKFASYSADQRNRHGSGLGLYIAKAITDAHDGEISAHNNSPERGATFTVSLSIKHGSPHEVTVDAVTRSQV
jgi:signal transduction histidine kinase